MPSVGEAFPSCLNVCFYVFPLLWTGFMTTWVRNFHQSAHDDIKLWRIVLQHERGKAARSSLACVSSSSNDLCLPHSHQTPVILFIYKGKAIIAEESKWFRYLIRRKMGLAHDKGADCWIPLRGEWVIPIVSRITILQEVSAAIKELGGLMFYDHPDRRFCKRASSIRIHSDSRLGRWRWNCTITRSLLEWFLNCLCNCLTQICEIRPHTGRSL